MAISFNPISYNFTESDDTKKKKQQADDQYNKLLNYGSYNSNYKNDLAAAVDAIKNREKFSYNAAEDNLYNIYKEQATRAGRQAMEDTQGKAAALTGGYGSSYGQTAGQQVYNSYMNDLNSKIPELEQLAYQRYQQEGQDLYNLASLYQGLDNTDYTRWATGFDQQGTLASMAQSMYDTAYSRDKNNYDSRIQNDWNNANAKLTADEYNDKMAYQRERDSVSDAQWREQMEQTKKNNDQSAAISSLKAQLEAKNTQSDSIKKKMLNTLKSQIKNITDPTTLKDTVYGYLNSNPYGYSGADYVDIVDEIANELGYGDNFMDDYGNQLKNRNSRKVQNRNLRNVHEGTGGNF